MKVTVIGTGYVGLVTGACLADSGNHVVGMDIDAAKIARLKQGESPIFEPGLTELLRDNQKAGRLAFTTDIAEAVHHATVIFLAIGTPPGPDGAADLTAMKSAAKDIGQAVDTPKIVVIKSTVPVGTGQQIENIIRAETQHPIHLVSNPEFLKEGSAVEDFLKPDRVVIGAEDEPSGQVIRELYLPFVRNQKPIIIMGRTASEMTKYAANAYLAMRISFINEIANLCDACGVDIGQVRQGIGTDERIGFHFLYPGVGYGGSCFPKDVQALAHVGRSVGADVDILEAVHRVNTHQRRVLFEKIEQRFGDDVKNMRFAFWGITFKPKTDDIREAPSLVIIEELLNAGATVATHDPQGLPHLKKIFGDKITYHDNAYDALNAADALVICTEWNEFRTPDFDQIKFRLKSPVIFDGRNLFPLDTMARHGFEYHSIGRPAVDPNAKA
jgi:UDPglucose 6-dehydrogenase